MNRRIYRKSVAPHNQRVATDIGIPTDRVDKFIELMNFYEARKDNIKLLYNPHLTGNKVRTSGNLKFVSKGYSANSVNQELGAELIPEASRTFSIDNDPYWVKSATTTVISGIATFNSLSSNWHLYNASVLTIGKVYSITYTILTRTAGYLIAQAGNTLAIGRGSTGTFTEILTCSVNSRVGFTSSDFVGTVDNVSVREVLSNDLTQTTSTSQPYLSGHIAPTETLGIENPNGGSNYLTHPTISFGAGDTWSITTVLNLNGSSLQYEGFCGSNESSIRFIDNYNKIIAVVNESVLVGKIYKSINYIIGKNAIITFVANGNNKILCYINGVYFDLVNIQSNFSFNLLLNGRGKITTSQLKHHVITSHAPTAQEVAQEHALLRSIYPDIESVRIGEQTWATSNCEMAATPQGNIIPEMVANGNVEKITNGGFDTDTVWIKQRSWTISNGVATSASNNTEGWIYQVALNVGRWYKATYTITNYVSGTIRLGAGAARGIPRMSVGTFTEFIQCTSAGFAGLVCEVNENFIGSVDNISFQEIGWSGSQELYDGIYAQTSGTVEQKTYAAVKAAAMWCYYGNSVDNGAVYGKLYNWFAVKLLQMDIDYYNAANPNNMWGWRVPTQSDFQQLSTYLGGDAVSGGKLKKEGLTYWNSPNTGATNVSGFSAIGGGRRQNDGYFFANNNQLLTHILDGDRWYEINFNSSSLNTYSAVTNLKSWGGSLRLIKVTQEQL